MTERLLPHDSAAERAVLGAALMDGALYLQAAQTLKPDDFYDAANRKIYRAMSGIEAGGAIDLITVCDRLQRNGDTIEDVGGFGYVSGLMDGLPRYDNIEHYAEIVKEKSLLRKIIAASTSVSNRCYAGESSAQGIYEGVLKDFAKLEGERTGVRLQSMTEAQEELVDLLRDGKEQRGNEADIIRAPWSSLERFNLFPRGDLSIIAGLTSTGKTMFMLNVAVAAARLGHGVLYFSKEDGGRKLRKRIWASMAGVPLRELMTRRFVEDSWGRLNASADEMFLLNLSIPGAVSYGLGELLAMAEGRHLQKRVDLIVVDYLQLFNTDGESRVRGLGEIAQRLRLLGQRLDAHVMIGSQLSREAAKKDVKSGLHERPRLDHLRESGELEQHADEVIFLYRADYFDAEQRGKMGETEMLIAKNRNGETGKAELYFGGECQQVRELTTSEILAETKGR